jgi:PAS domain S-box-containing protein
LPNKQADETSRALRADAEARLASTTPAPGLPPAELLHELEVHQIELEMQVEELRRSQVALEAARDRYQDLYELAPVGYLTVGGSGLVEEVNLTGASLLGEVRSDVVGRPFVAFVAPEDSDRWELTFRSIVEKDGKQSCDLKLRRKDGSPLGAALDCVRAKGSAGPAVRIALVDNGERERASKAFRQGEARLRAAIEASPVPSALNDEQGNITWLNEAFLQTIGYTLKDIPTLADWWPLAYPDPNYRQWVADTWRTRLEKARRTGTRFAPLELQINCKDGAARDFVVSAAGLVGDFTGNHLVTLYDITDQRQAVEALRESETRLHLALRGGDLGTWDWDIPSGRVAYNDRWAEMLGYSLGEIEPNVSSWERLLHPDDRLRNQPALDAALRGDTASWSWEQRLLHKDGHWVWVLGSGAVVARSPDGSALRAAGTHLDITDRKLAEEQRLVQEKRLDLAAEFGGLGLWDLDLTTNLAWRTLQHDRLFGYDEMQPSWGAEDALRHVVPEDRPIFQHALEEALTTGDFHYELRIDPKNHPRRWIQADGRVSRDDAGRPVRMAGIVLDITKRKLAEEAMGSLQAQLALTSRLAALGTLVAGVAHEINNPLAAALSDQELARGAVGELRERLRGGGPLDREAEVHHLDEVVEELDEAQDAGRRIARIVKDLRTFGRPNQTRTRTPLGDIVDLALRWVPVTAAHTATVTVENEGAPDVMASPGQIEQVVANLVTNAVNATQEGMRGAIVVRIGPGKPGMARLDVIDHGKGIDPAVMARIFEPFFTTRDVGKGMGLGLSICHAIVTNHGGTLTATSEAGKGSTFRVELPAATAEA